MPVVTVCNKFHPVNKLKGFGAMAGVLALVFVLAPGSARALTADGAMMTNIAMATYSGLGGWGTKYTVSYTASAPVLICNPVVWYSKIATPSMAAPTATVTFTVCAANNSITTSALNVQITDQIPGNMAFTGLVNSWSSPTWVPLTPFNGASVNGPWAAGYPAVGAQNSFLRWTFGASGIGPGKSGCVTYTASVL